MAFAAVYSEAFEIGPFSEASIGHVQAYPPQTGFVDQVITPTVGTGWLVAEDAVDKYVIRLIERHTGNRWVRLFARSLLNPSRGCELYVRNLPQSSRSFPSRQILCAALSALFPARAPVCPAVNDALR